MYVLRFHFCTVYDLSIFRLLTSFVPVQNLRTKCLVNLFVRICHKVRDRVFRACTKKKKSLF